jgi:hypothetical protein
MESPEGRSAGRPREQNRLAHDARHPRRLSHGRGAWLVNAQSEHPTKALPAGTPLIGPLESCHRAVSHSPSRPWLSRWAPTTVGKPAWSLGQTLAFSIRMLESARKRRVLTQCLHPSNHGQALRFGRHHSIPSSVDAAMDRTPAHWPVLQHRRHPSYPRYRTRQNPRDLRLIAPET